MMQKQHEEEQSLGNNLFFYEITSNTLFYSKRKRISQRKDRTNKDGKARKSLFSTLSYIKSAWLVQFSIILDKKYYLILQ